jgi:U3 small nucleolar RNA-associated protein 20
VLRFFAAMTSYMEATQLERFLPHILTPVYRITEEDTIRDSGMGTWGVSAARVSVADVGVVEELQTTASELQDLVQGKVGTTAFAAAYSRIRQGAVSVQQARRVARVTQVRRAFVACVDAHRGAGDDGPRGGCEAQAGEERDEKGESETKE